MNEHLPSSVELVQATLSLADLRSPTGEAEIIATLEGIAGVSSTTRVGDALHILYDPLQTTEREIEEKLRAGGHSAQGAVAERDSPFAS